MPQWMPTPAITPDSVVLPRTKDPASCRVFCVRRLCALDGFVHRSGCPGVGSGVIAPTIEADCSQY